MTLTVTTGYKALQDDRKTFGEIAQALNSLSIPQDQSGLSSQIIAIRKMAEDRIIALDALLGDV